MTVDFSFSFTTPVEIADLQDASRTSLLTDTGRRLAGIVTAKLGNGFYFQDPSPDADAATSRSSSSSSAPRPSRRRRRDGGWARERVPARRRWRVPEPDHDREIVRRSRYPLSKGNGLPAATCLGAGWRVPAEHGDRGRRLASVGQAASSIRRRTGSTTRASGRCVPRQQRTRRGAAEQLSGIGQSETPRDASIDTVRGEVVVSPDGLAPSGSSSTTRSSPRRW